MFDFGHFFCKFVLMSIRKEYLTYGSVHAFFIFHTGCILATNAKQQVITENITLLI